MTARRPGTHSVAALALLCGCSLYGPVEPPAPTVPADARFHASVSADREEHRSADPQREAPPWWRDLGDPRLDALAEAALAENLSVARAAARVESAAANRRIAGSFGLPEVDLFGEAEGELREGEDPDLTWAAGAALSWELDLWGRIASARAAAGAELAASREDLEAARLLLSAQLAEAYYGAVEQRLQIELLAEQRRLATTLLELTELRFLEGDASAVDVLQQRSQLTAVERRVPAARARLDGFEQRIDVLAGRAPDGRSVTEGASLPATAASVATGVPADLLVRRPDLRALRRRAEAADHRIGEALADRLPRLVLTGRASQGDVGSGPAPAAALAAEAIAPILDWDRRAAAVDVARAEHRDALLGFSEAFLVAVEEVETTLSLEARQRDALEILERRLAVLEQTVEQSRLRYVRGITDYLPVLTAVSALQEAQRDELAERRTLVSLRIQLHRAVGGALPPPPESP